MGNCTGPDPAGIPLKVKKIAAVLQVTPGIGSPETMPIKTGFHKDGQACRLDFLNQFIQPMMRRIISQTLAMAILK